MDNRTLLVESLLDMPAYTLVEFSPLLDSSDMTPEEWVYIATLIEESYYDYEGFVVIHGVLSNCLRLTQTHHLRY